MPDHPVPWMSWCIGIATGADNLGSDQPRRCACPYRGSHPADMRKSLALSSCCATRTQAAASSFGTSAYRPMHMGRCIRADAYRPMLTGRCMRADAYGPMHVGRCMLADARWPKWRALLAPNPPAFFSPGLPRFRDFLKTCNAVVGARIELNRNLKDMLSVDRRVCANRGASAGARNARGG